MLQFITAIAALVGAVLGVFAVEFGGEKLLHITAGGFIYLAAVTILPEILEDKVSLRFRLAQLLSFGLGVLFLFLVSVLEHSSPDGHHGHSHGHSHGHHHHIEEEAIHHENHDHHSHHDDHHNHHDHHHHHHHHEADHNLHSEL